MMQPRYRFALTVVVMAFLSALESALSLGFYVHIPFCRRRCSYCDFTIVPIGDVSADAARDAKIFAPYVDAVVGEIVSSSSALKDHWKDNPLSSSIIETVYFGGGTPSLLPPPLLTKILTTIKTRFNVSPEAEVTVECDPGTFGEAELKELVRGGFNRVSLGLQNFDDEVLGNIGRVHRSRDIEVSVELLKREAGLTSWSIDLISGLPGMTVSTWEETLDEVLRISPPHLSCYDLQVESGTKFGQLYKEVDVEVDDSEVRDKSGRLPSLPSSKSRAEMYKMASNRLRSEGGYEHYEVSSYALPGHRSRHNTNYWAFKPSWLAAGIGATSCINGRRVTRPKVLARYMEWLDKKENIKELESSAASAADVSEDDLTDFVLTALRTRRGLDLCFVEDKFGAAKTKKILKGAELALSAGICKVEDDDVGGHRFMTLTDPDGFLFSNDIISQIFFYVSE